MISFAVMALGAGLLGLAFDAVCASVEPATRGSARLTKQTAAKFLRFMSILSGRSLTRRSTLVTRQSFAPLQPTFKAPAPAAARTAKPMILLAFSAGRSGAPAHDQPPRPLLAEQCQENSGAAVHPGCHARGPARVSQATQ